MAGLLQQEASGGWQARRFGARRSSDRPTRAPSQRASESDPRKPRASRPKPPHSRQDRLPRTNRSINPAAHRFVFVGSWSRHRQKGPAPLGAQQSASTASRACHRVPPHAPPPLLFRCFQSDDGQNQNRFLQRLDSRARPGGRGIVTTQDRKSPRTSRRGQGARVGGIAILSHSVQDRAIRPVAFHCSRRSRQA
jgi:hypothetical protein